jgi:Tfp pilus assembly protein FimT
LNLARSEAVRRNQGVSIRADVDTGTVDYASGWKVFKDPLSTGAAPAASAVLRASTTQAAKTTLKRVTRSGTAPSFTYTDATTGMGDRMYVLFNPRGGNNGTSGAAFFRVCDTGYTSLGGRIVQVNTIGRISLDSSTASCP